jgi:hypothetical protein
MAVGTDLEYLSFDILQGFCLDTARCDACQAKQSQHNLHICTLGNHLFNPGYL